MASARTRPLLVALVAILAIALAAGTPNSAVAPDGSLGAGGEGGLEGGAVHVPPGSPGSLGIVDSTAPGAGAPPARARR